MTHVTTMGEPRAVACVRQLLRPLQVMMLMNWHLNEKSRTSASANGPLIVRNIGQEVAEREWIQASTRRRGVQWGLVERYYIV